MLTNIEYCDISSLDNIKIKFENEYDKSGFVVKLINVFIKAVEENLEVFLVNHIDNSIII